MFKLVHHFLLTPDGLLFSFFFYFFIRVAGSVINYFNVRYQKCKPIFPCRFVGQVRHKPGKRKYMHLKPVLGVHFFSL